MPAEAETDAAFAKVLQEQIDAGLERLGMFMHCFIMFGHRLLVCGAFFFSLSWSFFFFFWDPFFLARLLPSGCFRTPHGHCIRLTFM
jgi:hypothetical protein